MATGADASLVDGSVLTAVPDRQRMQRMQTPQGFRLETIVKAYRQAMADPHFRATDDCGVVMRYLPQTPIFIVPGDERAMKLTVPSDLPVLEQYLRSSDRQADVPAEEKPICAATRNKRRYVEQYHRTHLRELQLALLDILVAIDDDGSDLAFITVSLTDKNGTLCPDADHSLEFKVTGDRKSVV